MILHNSEVQHGAASLVSRLNRRAEKSVFSNGGFQETILYRTRKTSRVFNFRSFLGNPK